MKTKERILLQALQLFNTYGLKEVTLRRLALSLNMSQGNLNYHFATKKDIIIALYYRLVEEMNSKTEQLVHVSPSFETLFTSSKISMNKLYEYRFITKDLYAVLAIDEGLKQHYMSLQVIRKQQFLGLFQILIHQGIMRKEDFDLEYDRLYERMNILGDHWINAAILFHKEEATRVTYYHLLLMETIYPYLTITGKLAYKAHVNLISK